jgi:hypothetical protein
VTGLFAGQDVKVVDRVAFDVQARPLGSAYRPTSQLGGMTVWPSEPYWDQLQDGERLARDGVNFESHWRQEPPVGQLTLEAGKDFDVLVLALTMAAYKPLNAEDGSICQDLFAHSKKFHAFATQIGIVPTIALQLWCDWSLEELGCELGKCATVSGPQPFDIWADMSQVLDVESWPQGRRPASLHYLCGAYSTQLHKRPASDLSAPSEAFSELRSISKAWMETKAYGLWPRACAAGGFDWTALHDPAGGVGEARLDAQFWRANIDPTECCVGSEAGSTKHRLLPHESGFDNLILTGEATRHGLNGTAVEAAVMSGVAAAKAIQGQSYEDIPGFDFLMRAPWSVLLSPS